MASSVTEKYAGCAQHTNFITMEEQLFVHSSEII